MLESIFQRVCTPGKERFVKVVRFGELVNICRVLMVKSPFTDCAILKMNRMGCVAVDSHQTHV